MCKNELLRVLKQRIAEASSKKVYLESEDPVPALVEELQSLCDHIEKHVDEELGIAYCSCCWKEFAYRRA